jgi:hypothetical protein
MNHARDGDQEHARALGIERRVAPVPLRSALQPALHVESVRPQHGAQAVGVSHVLVVRLRRGCWYSCPLCTRHVVGVGDQSGPVPLLWAQSKIRLQRRFPSGESRD